MTLINSIERLNSYPWNGSKALTEVRSSIHHLSPYSWHVRCPKKKKKNFLGHIFKALKNNKGEKTRENYAPHR